MNNLVNTSRLQPSTGFCRRLFFIYFYCLSTSVSGQYYIDAICTNVDISVFDEQYIDSMADANFKSDGHCNTGAAYARISVQKTAEDGQPVKYVNIDVESMEDVNSDDEGTYVVENIPTRLTYLVKPVKEINVKNGITSSDMVILNKHLFGIKHLTSLYKFITCDINDNGLISVGDLYKMNALILGRINLLDKLSKFIRSDYIFHDPMNPCMEAFPEQIPINLREDMDNLDLFGVVLLGDPNYSANPRRQNGDEQKTAPIYLDAYIRHVNDGSKEITFPPPEDQVIDGMQYTLDFDPELIHYLDAPSTFGLNPNLVINSSNVISGHLGIVFINYDQKRTLDSLQLRFKTLTNRSLGTALTVTSDIHPPEGYMNDKTHPIELKYSGSLNPQLDLKITPNPFSNVTEMIIESDQIQTVDILIIDLVGRIVSQDRTTISKGPNTYIRQRTDFENAGIYFIRLSNHSKFKSKKIVLID